MISVDPGILEGRGLEGEINTEKILLAGTFILERQSQKYNSFNET